MSALWVGPVLLIMDSCWVWMNVSVYMCILHMCICKMKIIALACSIVKCLEHLLWIGAIQSKIDWFILVFYCAYSHKKSKKKLKAAGLVPVAVGAFLCGAACPPLACVGSPGHSSFLPQTRNILFMLIGDSTLPLGMSLNGCLSRHVALWLAGGQFRVYHTSGQCRWGQAPARIIIW